MFIQCANDKVVHDPNDHVVASINDHRLYQSEIDKQIEFKEGDSSLLVNSYIEKWVRDRAFFDEANKRLTAEDKNDIEKLTIDYKQSLVRLRYEESILRDFSDKNVSDAEIEEYYAQHKDDFTLDEAVVKAVMVKIPESAQGMESFWKSWQKNEEEKIDEYIEKNAVLHFNEKDNWKNLSDLFLVVPQKAFKSSEFKAKKTYQENFKDHEYFIRIFARKDKGESAPLSFVRENIIKVIAHKKEKAFLKRYKENLYQKVLDKKQFKLHQQ